VPPPESRWGERHAEMKRASRIASCLDRTNAREPFLLGVLMRMLFTFWNAMARVAEMLPQPPLTHN
jgi:hypothetical protein